MGRLVFESEFLNNGLVSGIIAHNIVIKIILKEEELELKHFGFSFPLKLISSKLITLSWLAKTCLCSQRLDLGNNWFTTIQNMKNYLYRSKIPCQSFSYRRCHRCQSLQLKTLMKDKYALYTTHSHSLK